MSWSAKKKQVTITEPLPLLRQGMLFRTICFFLHLPRDHLAKQYQILSKSCLTYCYQRGCSLPHLPLGASPHPFACSWEEMSPSAGAGHCRTVLGEAGGRSCASGGWPGQQQVCWATSLLGNAPAGPGVRAHSLSQVLTLAPHQEGTGRSTCVLAGARGREGIFPWRSLC